MKTHGMVNPFLRLIREGKISTLQQLKSTYRILLMKTHPDAVGSDRLVESHLSLSAQYEEARQFLEHADGANDVTGSAVPPNHRFAYFQVLHQLELIDKPYSFHRRQNFGRIQALKADALAHFRTWNGRNEPLYVDAERDYDRIKSEKRIDASRVQDLAIVVSPVFHNIVAYHLTGMLFYRKQVNQNLKAILQRLAAEQYPALKEFIELLLDDMNNGPAVFGEGKRIYRRISLDEGW
jgi:hypothetical protein